MAKGFVTIGRHEPIQDLALTPNTPTKLVSPNFPMDRFIHSLRLQFEGRVTNAGSGNPTGVQADSPYSIIDHVEVFGRHKYRKGDELFFALRGPDIRVLNQIWNRGGAPYATGTTVSQSASATTDIRFIIDIPFIPKGFPLLAFGKKNAQGQHAIDLSQSAIGYLLDCPNYDLLSLSVYMGDDKSILTGQTTASTWSAYGSTTGSARVRVSARFAQFGADAGAGFIPARVWRTFQESGPYIINGVTQGQEFMLNRGSITRSLLVKTGVKSTAVTAGNNAYNSYSDTIYANIKVQRGLGRVNRSYNDLFALKQETIEYNAFQPGTGYGYIDWAPNGKLSEALDTRALLAGASGDVLCPVVVDITAGSNQGDMIIQEELRGTPQN